MADPQLVVAANRLPVRRLGIGDEARWEVSPGGLVTAMLPALRETGGVWVGWSGTSGESPEPFTHNGIQLEPVALSRAEIELHYEGFSNGSLWPLYHDAVQPPEYHRSWWAMYQQVNRRFAERVAAVADEGALVWSQDYQLQLMPAFLRQIRPDLRVGHYMHIPFPPPELYVQMPWRRQVVEGLLGADLVGFQTIGDARNFHRVARQLTEATGNFGQLDYDGRTVRVGAFPIGLEVDHITELADSAATLRRAAEIRASLGSPRRVLLGVDRLDYTKGIDIRLRAYGELLDEGRLSPGEVVMVQVAEPSRSNVNGYVEMRQRVEGLVGEINGKHAIMGRPAIQYLHQGQPFDELVALYRAADALLVTPLRDGMNLVAKEYVAARTDDTGVLVLSEFAGAANELTSAVLVNPYDLDGLKRAIEMAVTMSPDEVAGRMHESRAAVRRNDVHTWAREFLSALSEAA